MIKSGKDKWRIPAKEKKELDQYFEKKETGLLERDIPIMLKIDENTDIRFNLRNKELYNEKVIKLSKPQKGKRPWLRVWFTEDHRIYYKFICLTTERLCFPVVNYDKLDEKWEPVCTLDSTIWNRQFISVYTKETKGPDCLIINYMDRDNTAQLRLTLENPDEWAKEINAVIEKKKVS